MGSWQGWATLAQVKRAQVVMLELSAKAMQRALQASQSAEQRQVLEDWPARVKRERLAPEVPAWQLDRPARAFAAPVGQRSIPSPAQLEYEQRLCFCRSSHRW